jgi:hypothetical protein
MANSFGQMLGTGYLGQQVNTQMAQQQQQLANEQQAYQMNNLKMQQYQQQIAQEKETAQIEAKALSGQADMGSMQGVMQSSQNLIAAGNKVLASGAVGSREEADKLFSDAKKLADTGKAMQSEMKIQQAEESQQAARAVTPEGLATNPEEYYKTAHRLIPNLDMAKMSDPEYRKSVESYVGNMATTKEQRDQTQLKIDTAAARVLAAKEKEINDEKKIGIRYAEAAKLQASKIAAQSEEGYDKLTEGGKALEEEFINAGKPVPKVRGIVDYKTLNAMADKEKGGAGSGAVTQSQAEYKATSGALANNTKDLAAIRPYKKMLDTNIDVAINLGKNVLKTNSAIANKSINWIKDNMGDNPDAKEYVAQIAFVQTEAARVLNNPRLVGQLTDSARIEMQHIVDGNTPINATERVLKRIQKDGENRVKAMEDEHDILTHQVVSGTDQKSSSFPKVSASEQDTRDSAANALKQSELNDAKAYYKANPNDTSAKARIAALEKEIATPKGRIAKVGSGIVDKTSSGATVTKW